MTKVGKYEFVRKLATGGMAEVFLAKFEWARGLEKTVVVKRILYHLAEDPSFIEMFFTEAQLAAQLSHPNIAQIIEFGESEGVYFLAMEYVDGMSLRALAAAAHDKDSGLPFAHCARIIAFCCEALAHAHELVDSTTGKPLNLVHRDVSPDNILLSRTGSVKLVDFGIAKAATQNHQTKTGLVKGKLAYMAPEQVRAQPLDRRADIYALGVVLYELLSGHKPYEGNSEITLIHAMLTEDMVPLRSRRADVPDGLDRIVKKALERDRDKRYADCREMHADLEEYLLSARQPVSALQLGQLVEKYRLTPVKAEAGGSTMATPARRERLATTPEPWHAPQRTPADGMTAHISRALAGTGTDGPEGTTAPATSETAEFPRARPVEKTEVFAAPSDPTSVPTPVFSRALPPVDVRPKAADRVEQSPGLKSRMPIVLAITGGLALLLAIGLVFFRKPPAAQQPHEEISGVMPPQVAPAPSEKIEKKGEPPSAAAAQQAPGSATPESHPQETPPVPKQELEKAQTQNKDKPISKPSPLIEFEVRSEPPGLIKVSAGGNLKVSHQSPAVARVMPGPVEIEVSASGERSFFKKESLVLEPTPKKQSHLVTVGKGTLMLRSFPAAHVQVDGVARDDTPVRLELYEGPHEVQFECDQSIKLCPLGAVATKSATVEIGKNKDLTQHWP